MPLGRLFTLRQTLITHSLWKRSHEPQDRFYKAAGGGTDGREDMSGKEVPIDHAVALRLARRLLATARSRTGYIRINEYTLARRILCGRCELTGIPFRAYAFSNLSSNPYAPSLDRRNVSGRYTSQNVRVVLWSVNRFRSDMKVDDFDTLIDEIRRSKS